eukprot:3236893-Amphidinium_carterae.1
MSRTFAIFCPGSSLTSCEQHPFSCFYPYSQWERCWLTCLAVAPAWPETLRDLVQHNAAVSPSRFQFPHLRSQERYLPSIIDAGVVNKLRCWDMLFSILECYVDPGIQD